MLDADNTKAISLAEFGRFFRELPLRAQAANLAVAAAAGVPVVTRRATSFAPRAARRTSASNLKEGLVSPVRSACVSKRQAQRPLCTPAAPWLPFATAAGGSSLSLSLALALALALRTQAGNIGASRRLRRCQPGFHLSDVRVQVLER